MIAGNIYCGDAATVLKKFPDECIDCVVTSPPYYGLRDYEQQGQIGGEETFEEYLKKLLEVTAELKRVLTPKGTLWWNHGDSYAGSGKGFGDKNPDPKFKAGGRDRTLKPKKMPFPNKSLMMQSQRLAIRMIDEQGWILRNQIIWHKPNAMPQSVKDRFTVDFEPILFFTKNKKYYFEQQYEPHLTQESRPSGPERNREHGYDSKFNALNKKKYTVRQKRGGNKNPDYLNPKGRNKRTVWSINTKPYPDAHFAVFPDELCETPIKAGCPPDGIVLDPFMGSGTTAIVAQRLGREWIGIELNPKYKKLADQRFKQQKLL